MCVILCATTTRLTDSMIERAAATNPDGNGIAWIADGAVEYRKGLLLEEVQDLAAVLPRPYVFHARIASVGGVRPELCHPFPLDRRLNPNQLRGRSGKGVLFHNGHWSDWREALAPAGPGYWSDSRAMAELVARFGPEAIPAFVPDSQRVVLLTPRGIERFGQGWTETSRGVWASNTSWLRPRCAIAGCA